MNIATYLRGRAKAFQLDAQRLDQENRSLLMPKSVMSENDRRSGGYKIAASELLNLADEIEAKGAPE